MQPRWDVNVHPGIDLLRRVHDIYAIAVMRLCIRYGQTQIVADNLSEDAEANADSSGREDGNHASSQVLLAAAYLTTLETGAEAPDTLEVQSQEMRVKTTRLEVAGLLSTCRFERVCSNHHTLDGNFTGSAVECAQSASIHKCSAKVLATAQFELALKINQTEELRSSMWGTAVEGSRCTGPVITMEEGPCKKEAEDVSKVYSVKVAESKCVVPPSGECNPIVPETGWKTFEKSDAWLNHQSQIKGLQQHIGGCPKWKQAMAATMQCNADSLEYSDVTCNTMLTTKAAIVLKDITKQENMRAAGECDETIGVTIEKYDRCQNDEEYRIVMQPKGVCENAEKDVKEAVESARSQALNKKKKELNANMQTAKIKQQQMEQEQFTHVSASAGFSCGVHKSGEPKCWGLKPEDGSSPRCRYAFCNHAVTHTVVPGSLGQLKLTFGTKEGEEKLCTNDVGQGTIPDMFHLAGIGNFRQLAAGLEHTCGLSEARMWCWGRKKSTGCQKEDSIALGETTKQPKTMAALTSSTAGAEIVLGESDEGFGRAPILTALIEAQADSSEFGTLPQGNVKAREGSAVMQVYYFNSLEESRSTIRAGLPNDVLQAWAVRGSVGGQETEQTHRKKSRMQSGHAQLATHWSATVAYSGKEEQCNPHTDEAQDEGETTWIIETN